MKNIQVTQITADYTLTASWADIGSAAGYLKVTCLKTGYYWVRSSMSFTAAANSDDCNLRVALDGVGEQSSYSYAEAGASSGVISYNIKCETIAPIYIKKNQVVSIQGSYLVDGGRINYIAATAPIIMSIVEA